MDEARKDSRVDLSMGAWGSFDTTVIGPCFGNVRNQHGQHGGNLLHTSRKLMMEWKVPLPPPTMTTPAFPDAKPASGFTGALGCSGISGKYEWKARQNRSTVRASHPRRGRPLPTGRRNGYKTHLLRRPCHLTWTTRPSHR